jgi:hypothetical protein
MKSYIYIKTREAYLTELDPRLFMQSFISFFSFRSFCHSVFLFFSFVLSFCLSFLSFLSFFSVFLSYLSFLFLVPFSFLPLWLEAIKGIIYSEKEICFDSDFLLFFLLFTFYRVIKRNIPISAPSWLVRSKMFQLWHDQIIHT